jgi:hypothetical protein
VAGLPKGSPLFYHLPNHDKKEDVHCFRHTQRASAAPFKQGNKQQVGWRDLLVKVSSRKMPCEFNQSSDDSVPTSRHNCIRICVHHVSATIGTLLLRHTIRTFVSHMSARNRILHVVPSLTPTLSTLPTTAQRFPIYTPVAQEPRKFLSGKVPYNLQSHSDSCPLLSCPSLTSCPVFALILPSRLFAMAHALLGMVDVDLLLLLLHEPSIPPAAGDTALYAFVKMRQPGPAQDNSHALLTVYCSNACCAN